MRRAVALIVAMAALSCATGAQARTPDRPANCAHSSTGTFSGFHSRGNVVVGPLAFVGAARLVNYPLSTRPGAWMKSPALVLPGHTVTIRITGASRQVSGFLGYGRGGEAGTGMSNSRGSVTLTACKRGHRGGSTAGGRPVTFFSGGFVQPTAPSCIAVDVYADRSPRATRVFIALGAGAGACPKPAATAVNPASQCSPAIERVDLGESYEGLSVERTSACYATGATQIALYGSCRAASDSGCSPPLQVQTWRACERNLAQYTANPGPGGPLPLTRDTLRGVPIAILDGGRQIELYTGDVTVVIFADTTVRALESASVLEGTVQGAAITPLQAFPPPLPGALEGTLACP